MKKIILASTSPRRKELLSTVIDNFEIRAPLCDEIETGKPESVAVKNAERKARCIMADKSTENSIIIACDTLVARGDTIYGKPSCKAEAKAILKELKGRWHDVFSGVFIKADKEYNYSVRSKVFINDLTDEQIEEYIDKYSPYDKAGSYGIQDAIIVKEYYGDYDNIVGLPLCDLRMILRENGVDVKE